MAKKKVVEEVAVNEEVKGMNDVEAEAQAIGEQEPTKEFKEVAEVRGADGVHGLTNLSVKEGYELTQDAEGKFHRKAVYQSWSSIIPETRAQKIAMMNLLNSGDEASALSDYVGAQIEIADVIFSPYDKVNEETGELEYGVLSYILTLDSVPYVTSSKSVYFTLKRMFQVFGEPSYNADEVVKVQVVRKKGREFQYIDLKILG